jgi:uncharacterized protein
MAQSWHDMLFAHWRIDAALLRPHIPTRLEIDPFQGQAWVAVVPFRMSGVRLRATPALPALSAFAELNVRTYVVADQKPGVWFFSLDAGSPLAVVIARAWLHLPYFRARMKCEGVCGRIHPARMSEESQLLPSHDLKSGPCSPLVKNKKHSHH